MEFDILKRGQFWSLKLKVRRTVCEKSILSLYTTGCERHIFAFTTYMM